MIRSLLGRLRLRRGLLFNKERVIYLAGPMSGILQHNYPAFFEAEKRLIKAGFVVVNPAWLNDEKSGEIYWRLCLRNDLSYITKYCSGIALLPGWVHSKGATLELATALRLGMFVIDALTLEDLQIEVAYNWGGKHGPKML